MGMDRKKGVSLVEVVVAMAIIVIISVSALSVALSTSRITDKASLRFQAVNQIEDIVTLAEAAESKADFVEKLKKTAILFPANPAIRTPTFIRLHLTGKITISPSKYRRARAASR